MSVDPGHALTAHRQVIFTVRTGAANSALKWEPSLSNILCATDFPLAGQRLLQMVETNPPLIYGRPINENLDQQIRMKEIFYCRCQ